MENVANKYNRQIKGVLIDVYDILQAFPTGNEYAYQVTAEDR